MPISVRDNENKIVVTKPDKGNGAAILDRKLYDNVIQVIISDTSRFGKLSEDLTLKRDTSLHYNVFYVS